jgi:hypothetical protein
MVTGSQSSVLQGGHASRLMLARLIAGDLDDAGRAELNGHIKGCARCGETFAKAESQAALFAAKHPTWESLAAGRKAAPAWAEPSVGWLEKLSEIFGGLGLKPIFATLSLLVVAAVIWTFNGHPVGEDLTAKGGTRFLLDLNGREIRGGEVSCKPSDTLQLSVTSATPVYYAVLYRDDDGKPALYMGAEGSGQKALGLPQGENLPHSLVLGEGWQQETLYCVWSAQPFTAEEAEAFVQDPSGPNPKGLHAQIFQLKNLRS